MVPRDLTPSLKGALRHYPIVTITGPRQSGKTTLSKAVAAKPYANLEAPDVSQFVQVDPRAFLAQFPAVAVLDEEQRVPRIGCHQATKQRVPGTPLTSKGCQAPH